MSLQEAARGIYGALLLARFDRNGIHLFENSVEAWLRSFWAAALCAPVYIVLILMRSMEMSIGAGMSGAVIIYTISYIIGWTAYPVVMISVTRLLGKAENYFRYIAAYNWATFLQISALLAVSAVVRSGVVSAEFTVILTMGVIFAIFIYKGFIAHAGLGVGPGPAIGLVMIDFILALIFESWTLRLLQVQAVPINSGG